MNASKHTPGPWTVKHINGSNFAVQEFEIRGECQGKPHIFPIFNKDRSAIDGCTIFVSPEDASLIAAAPEMLAVLQKLRRSDLPDNEQPLWDEIQAAIAKAERGA